MAVAASGTPPLAFQWTRNGQPITGATASTLLLPDAQAEDAGDYAVLVSNAVGSIASQRAALTVISATHAVVGGSYAAGSTVTTANTCTYTGPLTGFGWQVLLPSGWSYASGGGQEGDGKPPAGATEVLEWTWTSVPANPVAFTYTLQVPADATGVQTIDAAVQARQAHRSFQVLVRSDSLPLVPASMLHSADTDRDGKLSLTELLRVIELYNTRIGTTRSGCYLVQTATEDGFAGDPSTPGTAIVTLSRYHSADANRDGKFCLTELLRVIELYNYRSGTVRSGQYHLQAGTEDGFNPGL